MRIAEWLHLPRTGYIGLYITDGFLSAVQLRGTPKGKKYKVIAWSMAALPSEAVKEGQVINKDILAEHLGKLFAHPNFGQFEGKNVVLTMAEHQSFHHVFSQATVLAEKTLYATAFKNTMPNVPYTNDEVYWDWEIIKKDPQRIHFYSVVVPRNVLTPFRTALTQIGYSTSIVETEVLSSARFFFGRSRLDEGILLVQVGYDEICVATIDEMGVHQSSIIPDEGIQVWADQLGNAMKISSAEALKKLLANGLALKKGSTESKEIATFLLERAKMIAAEMQEHHQFFMQRAHEKSKTITGTLVIGAGGLLPGLSLYLAKVLKLHAFEPGSAASYTPEWRKAQLAVLHEACGAAILGLQKEQAVKSGVNIIKSQATTN